MGPHVTALPALAVSYLTQGRRNTGPGIPRPSSLCDVEDPSACWQAAAHIVRHPQTLQQAGSGHDAPHADVQYQVVPSVDKQYSGWQAAAACDDQRQSCKDISNTCLHSAWLHGCCLQYEPQVAAFRALHYLKCCMYQAHRQRRKTGTALGSRLSRPSAAGSLTTQDLQCYTHSLSLSAGAARAQRTHARTICLLGRVTVQAGASGDASLGGGCVGCEGVVRAPVPRRPHLLLLEGGSRRGGRGAATGGSSLCRLLRL